MREKKGKNEGGIERGRKKGRMENHRVWQIKIM